MSQRSPNERTIYDCHIFSNRLAPDICFRRVRPPPLPAACEGLSCIQDCGKQPSNPASLGAGRAPDRIAPEQIRPIALRLVRLPRFPRVTMTIARDARSRAGAALD